MIRPFEILCVLLMLATTTAGSYFRVPVGNPPDHTIEARGSWAWESKFANEQAAFINIDLDRLLTPAGVDELKDEQQAESVVEADPYKRAYEAANAPDGGKLYVYIEMDNCPHCPAALKAFEDAEAKCDGVCVKLHVDRDRKYAADIADEVVIDGKVQYPCPQVVTYRRVNGEWKRKAVVGAKVNEITALMLGDNSKDETSGLASVPAEKLHESSYSGSCVGGSCVSGSCSHGDYHSGGSCSGCGGGLVRGQPVRNLAKVVVKTGKAFAEAVRNNWPTYRNGNPVGWRLNPRNWPRCR